MSYYEIEDIDEPLLGELELLVWRDMIKAGFEPQDPNEVNMYWKERLNDD